MNVLSERRKVTTVRRINTSVAKDNAIAKERYGFNAKRTVPITTSVAYPEQTPDSDISGFIRPGNDIPYPLSI